MNTEKPRTEILRIPGLATLYLAGEYLGAWNRHEVRDVTVEVGPYAQYPRAYFLTFTPKGKRRARSVVLSYKPRGVVCEGHGLPDMRDPFMLVRESPGVTVTQSRRMAHDPAWDDEAREQLAGITAVLDIEKHATA